LACLPRDVEGGSVLARRAVAVRNRPVKAGV
jgi:hypothetical protein